MSPTFRGPAIRVRVRVLSRLTPTRLTVDHLPIRQCRSEGWSYRRQEDRFAQGYRPYRDLSGQREVWLASSSSSSSSAQFDVGGGNVEPERGLQRTIMSCCKEWIMGRYLGRWSSGWSRLMIVS